MLKRTEAAGDPPPGGSERPVGEILAELIEEAKAYARAELGVLKAIAATRGKALVLPAILVVLALVLLLVAVTAFAVGVVLALAKFVGPLAAGLLGMAIFGGLAGAAGWYAYERGKRIL
jgi:protein-S-isoprenylcysteine O-methyltransferase Ste14